ncbi:MAG: helicase [Candidatus Hydrogenedentes bacterium]|nr:helicase [Candidatus Hydrogenedentota bacterium]
MPKLNSFTIEIQTGETEGPERLQYSINGFPLDFDEMEGGSGAGETLTATGAPQSFPHTLLLRGPEQGRWDIQSVRLTFECDGDEPYTIQLGAVTLDSESDLNIWHEPPMPVFDV